MRKILDIHDLKQIFDYVAQQIIANEAFLTAIDKKIGDGDHGTNMALGFREVQKELHKREFDSVNEIFHCVGMTLLDTMGGASGVLFGTVFISGIVGLEPQRQIDLSGVAEIFQKSLVALKKRGKANIGDKTMVDALEPATMTLVEAAAAGLAMEAAFENAAFKAKEGMEYTKQCVAKFGRAKSFGTAAIGLEDTGSVSVWIIFRSIAEWLNSHR